MNARQVLDMAHESALADLKATRDAFPMTEEQRLALDRSLNATKNSPAYDAQEAARALQRELNQGGA